MNLFLWDMRREKPATVPGAVGWPTVHNGPRVLPGVYEVALSAGPKSDGEGLALEVHAQKLPVEADPRQAMSASERALAATYGAGVYALLDRVHKAVIRIREVRGQVTAARAWAKRAGKLSEVKQSADALLKPLREIEDALIQTKSKSSQDPLNYPVRLNDKIATLLQQGDSDPRPTQGQLEVFASLKQRVEAELEKLEAALKDLIPAFNEAVWAARIPAVEPEQAQSADAAK